MKRRIGYTILIVLFLGVIAAVYINNIFLPIQFKQIIIDKARTFLDRDITIGKITCGPIQGINVYDINIYKKDATGQPFLSVKKLSFKILLPPIFKNQKLLIPKASLTQPIAFINRTGDADFNFSDIIRKMNKKQSRRLLIGGLQVEGGTLYYDDLRTEESRREVVEQIKVKSNITLKKSLKFTSGFKIRENPAKFQIEGEYALADKKLSMQVAPEKLDLKRFLPLAYSNPRFTLNNGELESGSFNITWKGDAWTVEGAYNISQLSATVNLDKILKANYIRAETVLKIHPEEKNLDGKLQIREMRFEFPTGQEYRGNIQSDIFSWKQTASSQKIDTSFRAKGSQLTLGPDQIYKGDITTKGAEIIFSDSGVQIHSAIQIDETDFQLGENVRLKGIITSSETSATVNEGIVSLQSLLKLNHGNLQLPNDISLLSEPDIELSLEYNPYSEGEVLYSGVVQLDRAVLLNIPIFEKITDITGKVSFAKDKVETDQLQLLSPDAGVILKGSLKNFNDPILNITYASPGITLEKIEAVFEKYLQQIKTKISGQAQIQGRYKGPLSKPEDADINIIALLNNAEVRSEHIPNPISNLSGELLYKYDLIKLSNFAGTYTEKPYTLNAELKNFSRPKVFATLGSNNLNLNGEINILRNVLQIISLRGFYYDTALDIKTDVHFDKGDSVYLNLRGDVNLDLTNLKYFFPKAQPILDKLKPTGNLENEIFFKGFVNQWKDWQFVVSSESPSITLLGLKLNDVSAEYEQRDQNINMFKVSSGAYAGNLSLLSSADLTKDENPYQMIAQLTNVDLALLKNDTKLSNRKISGKLKSAIDVKGNLAHAKKSTAGTASFSINEGEIWQFQFLSKLWETLGFQQFGNIKFTDAYGDFQIEKGRMKTENLTLDSRQLKLDAIGWIDFDQNIDFKIKTKSNEAYMANNNSIVEAPLKYLTKPVTLMDFHVGGTFSNPKVLKITPHLPEIEVIDKTKDVLMNGLKNIVEGLF